MLIRVLTLLAMLVAHCYATANGAEGTIVVVGDSLSSGYGLAGQPSWVDLLAQRLQQQEYGYQVVNASIAGDTSAGGLARMPRLLETHMPSVVIIEMGGNDGLRGQPLATLRDNLDSMIKLAATSGARVVLAGIQIPPNFGPSYTEALAMLYHELAEQHEVALVEFFMAGVALHNEFMQSDGIHPNAAGQPLLLDNVWPVLIEQL